MRNIAKVCGWLALGCALFAAGIVDPNANKIRIAFSDTLVGEVNSSDVRVAIKGWVDALMHDTALTIEFDSSVISTPEQIVHRLRTRTVDGVAFTTPEFFQASSMLDPTVVIDELDSQGGDEYLLLANVESAIEGLSDLRGHSLVCYKNTRMCLALPWLETALGAANLSGSDAFFASKSSNGKLAKVVLPVFFKQADSCLVTRRGFETMCELNPQLAKRLKVVAKSPRMISILVAFQKDCSLVQRQRYVGALTGLYKSATGRQALVLFQTSRLVQSDASMLKSATEMLSTYERIKGKQALKK